MGHVPLTATWPIAQLHEERNGAVPDIIMATHRSIYIYTSPNSRRGQLADEGTCATTVMPCHPRYLTEEPLPPGRTVNGSPARHSPEVWGLEVGGETGCEEVPASLVTGYVPAV